METVRRKRRQAKVRMQSEECRTFRLRIADCGVEEGPKAKVAVANGHAQGNATGVTH